MYAFQASRIGGEEAFERALKGESVQIEIEASKRDGSTFPMLLNLCLLYTSDAADE